MPHLPEFFDNVQLPSMPDVARDLVAMMQGDDIPLEKVLLAEIGLEEHKSPADTIASLRKSSGRCHWTRTGWPNICRRWRTLWMCLCADAGRAKTCVSIHPKRKAPRGLSCVRA